MIRFYYVCMAWCDPDAVTIKWCTSALKGIGAVVVVASVYVVVVASVDVVVLAAAAAVADTAAVVGWCFVLIFFRRILFPIARFKYKPESETAAFYTENYL